MFIVLLSSKVHFSNRAYAIWKAQKNELMELIDISASYYRAL